MLAVAVGADAVGFVFAPSLRQIAPQRVADIVKRLPQEVLTVGVFRNESPSRVIQLIHQTGLQAAQLHGHETPKIVQHVKSEVRTVFKAVAAGTSALERADQFGADAILVDAQTPGSGQVFDWGLAEGAPASVPLIMAGGLTPKNVADAIAKVDPWGVDVSSGVERSPGVKDPVLVRKFVAAARAHLTLATAPETSLGPEPYDWTEDPTWR